MRDGVIERDGEPVLELSPPMAVSGLEVGATVAFDVEVPEGGLDVRIAGGDVVHLEAGRPGSTLTGSEPCSRDSTRSSRPTCCTRWRRWATATSSRSWTATTPRRPRRSG